MKRFFLAIFAVVATASLAVSAAPAGAAHPMQNSLVTIEVTRKVYDYIQPWNRRVDQVQKMGLVTDGRQILTTADLVFDHTLVRLQKGGRGKWYQGKVLWVDYHMNLAAVSTEEKPFWDGLKPAQFAKVCPRSGTTELVRWRAGNFEARKVEINRLHVKRAKLSYIDYMQLEVDCELSGFGWGEPMVVDGKVIGLTISKDEHVATALPCGLITRALAARKAGKVPALGLFAFVWQQSENPATLEYLKLPGEPRGAIVIEVPAGTQPADSLKPRDVILELEGFPIDLEGDYKDPDYGNLSLENLSSRAHWAGDSVKMKVLREGKIIESSYVLPKADFSKQKAAEALYDQEPEYVILGGLIFQPLSVPYLQSWGADWARKAPFRLAYTAHEKPTPERPKAVFLSLILPDPVNQGYQDARYLVLDSVNGKPVSTLADLVAARRAPVNGFHEILFQNGEGLRKLVLDAAETEKATGRILRRYSIENDYFLADPR